jgi:hypothetical protein
MRERRQGGSPALAFRFGRGELANRTTANLTNREPDNCEPDIANWATQLTTRPPTAAPKTDLLPTGTSVPIIKG